MCVCGGREGGLCNVVVEFHVHTKLVMLIKMYANESCNKVWIGKTLSGTFTVQNGLESGNQGDCLWPEAIVFFFLQKFPLGISKQARRE